METYQSDRDIKLTSRFEQPLDTIQQILWSQNNTTFWTVGWDACARYYKIAQSYNSESIQQLYSIFLQEPILCCTWDQNSNLFFTGHINGQIKAIQLSNSNVAIITKLQAPVCKIFWVKQKNVLISIGFESKIQFWQLGNSNPAFTLKIQQKITAADFRTPYLIISNITDKVSIINLNANQIIVPKFQDCQLEKYSKIQCIQISKDMNRFIAGSMDGRCTLHTFTFNYSHQFTLKNQVTFKGQFRKSGYSNYILYPLTAVGFNNSINDWLFVAGGQPSITFYAIERKDMLKEFKLKTAVSAAKCSPCGKYLAYATGSIWIQGLKELGMYETKIFCHRIKSDQMRK